MVSLEAYTDMASPQHALTSEPTLCAIKALRAYFIDGVLPEEQETFCASQAPPFVVQALEEVLAPLAEEGTD
jgi:hypothetical protein